MAHEPTRSPRAQKRSNAGWLRSLAAVVALLAGCIEPSQPPEHTQMRQAAQVVRPSAATSSPTQSEHATGEMAPDELAHERTRKLSGDTARETVLVDVDWDAVQTHPRLSTVTDHLRTELESVPVPVLLPDEKAMLDAGFPSRGPHWYAVGMNVDGLSIYVSGTREAFRYPHIARELAEVREPERVTISRSHGVVTLSWVRFGVAYHVDVECARPLDDVRCTGDEYVRSLYRSMALLQEAAP